MVVLSIIKIGDELLRQKSDPIIKFGTDTLKQLKEDLKDTLMAFKLEHGLGRGIAAVQIGELKRVIYVKTNEFEGMLCNPVIKSKSSSMFWTWDSCFSADVAFFIKVQRHYEIEIEYFDFKGKKKKLIAEGSLSELLQHEIDHLDGILFIDYLGDQKKALVMKEIYESIKQEESFL